MSPPPPVEQFSGRQVTVPSPPPISMQRMRNTKQVMQTQGHMNHKMSHELPVGMHGQLNAEKALCATFCGGSI